MNIKATFDLNIQHLLSHHECEDKTRYISFIEFIEQHISPSDFDSWKGFALLERILESDQEFFVYSAQRIYSIYFKCEATFLKYQTVLPMFKMNTNVLLESFLEILKSVSSHKNGKEWIDKNYQQLVTSGLINSIHYIREVAIDTFLSLGYTDIASVSSNSFILEYLEKLDDIDQYKTIITRFYIRKSIDLLKKSKNIVEFDDYILSLEEKDMTLMFYAIKNLKLYHLKSWISKNVHEYFFQPKYTFRCISCLTSIPWQDEFSNLIIKAIRDSKYDSKVILSSIDVLECHKKISTEMKSELINILEFNNYKMFEKIFVLLSEYGYLDEKIILECLQHTNHECKEFCLEFLVQHHDLVTPSIQKEILKNMDCENIHHFLESKDLMILIEKSSIYRKTRYLRFLKVDKDNIEFVKKQILMIHDEMESMEDWINQNIHHFDKEFLSLIQHEVYQDEPFDILEFFEDDEHLDCD